MKTITIARNATRRRRMHFTPARQKAEAKSLLFDGYGDVLDAVREFGAELRAAGALSRRWPKS